MYGEILRGNPKGKIPRGNPKGRFYWEILLCTTCWIGNHSIGHSFNWTILLDTQPTKLLCVATTREFRGVNARLCQRENKPSNIVNHSQFDEICLLVEEADNDEIILSNVFLQEYSGRQQRRLPSPHRRTYRKLFESAWRACATNW